MEEISQDERDKIREEERKKIMKEIINSSATKMNRCETLTQSSSTTHGKVEIEWEREERKGYRQWWEHKEGL